MALWYETFEEELVVMVLVVNLQKNDLKRIVHKENRKSGMLIRREL